MDCLIIGAGLSGAVIARYLAEQCNKKVCIWERRNHIGGNMFDYVDAHNIRVQKYGPHIFHTNEKSLFDFMQQFVEMTPFKLTYKTFMNGRYTNTPFNFNTIDTFYPPIQAELLKNALKKYFSNKAEVSILEMLKADELIIKQYADFLFTNDYKPYTSKQWGISIDKIDSSILSRVKVRFSYDDCFFNDIYQSVPKEGFSTFFQNILNHPNITVTIEKDGLKSMSIDEENNRVLVNGKNLEIPVVYTGALDELFGMDAGILPYRSLVFKWVYEINSDKQPAAVVAYPQEKFTRITEYKKLPIQDCVGTSYAIEYPASYNLSTGQEPYYPVLTEESKDLSDLYKQRANNIRNFYFCGRLADFEYYNIDQTLKRALEVCKQLKI